MQAVWRKAMLSYGRHIPAGCEALQARLRSSRWECHIPAGCQSQMYLPPRYWAALQEGVQVPHPVTVPQIP